MHRAQLELHFKIRRGRGNLFRSLAKAAGNARGWLLRRALDAPLSPLAPFMCPLFSLARPPHTRCSSFIPLTSSISGLRVSDPISLLLPSSRPAQLWLGAITAPLSCGRINGPLSSGHGRICREATFGHGLLVISSSPTSISFSKPCRSHCGDLLGSKGDNFCWNQKLSFGFLYTTAGGGAGGAPNLSRTDPYLPCYLRLALSTRHTPDFLN